MPKRQRFPTNKALVRVRNENIEDRIFTLRGHKVMLDSDLADVYGVTPKRLNEQVKRNRNRFPADFLFQLTTVAYRQDGPTPGHSVQALSRSHRGPVF